VFGAGAQLIWGSGGLGRAWRNCYSHDDHAKAPATNGESIFCNCQRMVAYFTASLETPSSPYDVANTIQSIVDCRSSKFRNPAGHDGAKLIQWRKEKTDEEWAKMGTATDAAWAADAKQHLGVDVRLP
jgi:hypothetical protein